MNNIPEIEALIQTELDAHIALEVACEKRWPVGTRVGVILRHGQTNPTIGTIEGFRGYMALVRLEAQRRRHGRVVGEWLHSCKEVYYTQIVYVENEGGAK